MSSATSRFATTVAALAYPPELRTQPLAVLHVVLALRLRALFDAAGRDPVAELATRFGSVPAALAVLDLVGEVAASWPEAVVVRRPCCRTLSPDEATVSGLVGCAARGDRAGASRHLAGFVAARRHDRLFDAACAAVGELSRASAA